MSEPYYTSEADNLLLEVFYENGTFKVKVTNKDTKEFREEIVPCLHQPIFGIDVEDQQAINEVSEKLALEIE